MQPQTSQTETLDPQAVNLAKAIRQTESGGDFTAKGKSGEFGAYQYTEPTWQKDSAAAGVHVPLSQATPEQQNEVAYKKIKSLKDQGLNVGEIASVWNSGDRQAYTGTFSSGKPAKGTNAYDVPAYAKSVATAYQALKSGGQAQLDPQNPSSIAAQQPESLGQKIIKGAGSVFNTLAAPIEGIAAIPVQAAAKALGQPDPYAQGIPSGLSSLGAEQTPITPLTPEAKAGDVAQVGSYFVPGEGIASMAASGALQGAGQAMSKEQSAPEVAQAGTMGGLLGGAIGSASSLINKASTYLPQRIARSFLPGTSQETAEYAVNKGLGTPSKMLAESDASLSKIGDGLSKAIESEQYVLPSGEELLGQVATQFPHSGLGPEEIADEIKSLVPLKKRLVDKMVAGDISAKELHSLNSAVGKATYKSVFDTPTVKAGKSVGNAFYQTISSILKTDKTAPLFDEYTKELQLNGALTKAVRSGQKARMLTLRDLVAFGSAMGVTGNPLIGLGGVAAEKALVNPSLNLKAAGLMSKLNSQAIPTAARMSLPFLTKPLVPKNSSIKPQSK